MKHRSHRARHYKVLTFLLFLFSSIFFNFYCSSYTFAADNIIIDSLHQFGSALSDAQLNKFSQNNILFYDPSDCIDNTSAPEATGEYGEVMKAKNADKWFFNGEGNVPSAQWDTSESSMKLILETYGDLAYQTGRAAGIPWVAILAQMHFEDPQSVCGHNNFWGNGCDSNHAYVGGADEVIGEAKNLGEGFIKYAETAHNGYYEEALTKTDPLEYIRALEGTWIGTGASYNIQGHIDAMTNYIKSSEGEAIVKQFRNYSGFFYDEGGSSNSSSSNSSQKISGDDIIWVGDSDSALAHDEEGYGLIERTFPGVDYGSSFNENGSYIQSGKFIDHDDGGNLSGLNILKDIIDQNKLRPYLVFALGGNGGWNEDGMEEFLNLIDGKDVKVIITTTKYKGVDYPEGNAIAKKAAEENSNIYLADIAANYKDEYFSDSDIEFNSAGGKMFVQTIKDALNKAGGEGCTTYEGEYPQYAQWDEPWGSLPYGPNGGEGGRWTYGNSACGAASMAMLATVATGQDIFPNDIGDFLEEQYNLGKIPEGHYPYYDKTSVTILDPIVGEHYGFEVINETYSDYADAEEKMREYLKDGYMIHLTGAGTDFFGPDGHLIGIYDIDQDDNVMIANSAWTLNGKWPLKDVASGILHGVFTAIKGKNTGKNTCEPVNYCNSSNTGTGTESSKPIGPIHESSENIACDPRTKDLGVRDDAYYNYEKYSIRLCSIPNIKMNGTQGDDGDDGFAHVNSRVSGAFYSLSEEHKNKCGNYLEAVDDYRTNAEQTYYYNCYITQSCNGGNLAAEPGSIYSNHQGGLAIDFDTSTYCSSDSSVASGPGGLLDSDFLAKFGLEDGRYFSQFENWHVQAIEE